MIKKTRAIIGMFVINPQQRVLFAPGGKRGKMLAKEMGVVHWSVR